MRANAWVATAADSIEFIETDVPAPGKGEVTVRITVAGINPADLKHAARATSFPHPLGYEIAGEIVAIGPDTDGLAVGDAVLAFRVYGGFAEALTVPAKDVFLRPAALSDVEAATLLLAATTASDMLHTVRAGSDDTVVVFGASGSVGLAALQLGRRLGARMIGVSGEHGRDAVLATGAEWMSREDIARVAADAGAASGASAVSIAGAGAASGASDHDAAAPTRPAVTAALDATGADTDVDAALALVADRSRIVTIAAPARAASVGFAALGGTQPASASYRDAVRPELIALAASGALRIPVSRTFPLADAREALAVVSSGHPSGKVALTN